MRRSSGGEAPKACTDDMLETMLEVNAAWHTDDDSGVAGWPKQRGSQSHRAQQRVTDSQAAAAQVDDYALIDTADDTKHADGDKKLRYYHLRVTGRVRVLAAALATDWGVLRPGDHVLDEYYFLFYKPGNPARWYVRGYSLLGIL